MNIVICGLGYVGVTAAASLLKDGHSVTGIDINVDKVAAVNAGQSPVSEPEVSELLAAGLADGRLAADTDVTAHLAGADLVFVCVGTPSTPAGGHDMRYVEAVANELGAAIAGMPGRADPLLIVFRSTVQPGSMEGLILPALENAAGEAPGGKYEIAFNPEFLRESTAVADYFAPPKIVIGEREPGITKRLLGVYDGIDAPVFELPFGAAEMVKLTDNAFHALKVSFGNEVGRIALDLGVDPQAVIDVFLADTKLNISPYYFRPGGPFGGSCLPKDVRAINALAGARGVQVPVMASMLPSNEAHKDYLAGRVLDGLKPGGSVLLLGLSFKSATDDLRESPLVDLAETLIGKGVDLKIYDPDLKGRELIGANLRFIEERLPHLSRLLIAELSEAPDPDLIVIGKRMGDVEAALAPDAARIDFVSL